MKNKFFLAQPGWDEIIREMYGRTVVIRTIENLSEAVRTFRTHEDMDREYRYLQRLLLEMEND